MSRKWCTPEDQRKAARSAGLGPEAVRGQVCRTLGVGEQTFPRCGHEYGGLTKEHGKSFKHFYDYLLRLSKKVIAGLSSILIPSSSVHPK